jgi:hypothetical protein
VTDTAIDQRYGRTPGRARRERLILIVAGILFGLVIGAWVIWAGLDSVSGGLDTRDLGHKVNDEFSVNVQYEVTVPQGTEVSCALQAQNDKHAIVGWKIVDLPASDSYTRRFTEEVRTSELAVTGLIYRCWLT